MKVILDLCGGTGSWSKPYKDAGYDVLVFVASEYEDLGRITCGNALLGGSKVQVPHKILS